jgi:L-lactate dehydrogenase complex protein LldG
MTTGREEVLRRVRWALADRREPPPVVRDYRTAGTTRVDLDRFADRVRDYQATVTRIGTDQVRPHLTAELGARGARRVLVPAGFPPEWTPDLSVVRDEPPLSVADLDGVDAVVTSCAVAIAETGTVVLDHGAGQGRRAITLVPDHHVVVVRADQVVALVPDAVARLDPARPLTWISGPSATSDIELRRVEGVHGPRRLDVLLVD